MNIYATMVYIFIFNILAFVLLNFFAYNTNKAEIWLNAMKSIFMKTISFIFAFPLLLIFIFFYIKGRVLK